MNTTAALIFFFYIITPILYFTNMFYAKYLPIFAYISFDNADNRYNPSAIVTDGKSDLSKYDQYSPLFVSSTLAMAYASLPLLPLSSFILSVSVFFAFNYLPRSSK
jgi:hypothetical protein